VAWSNIAEPILFQPPPSSVTPGGHPPGANVPAGPTARAPPRAVAPGAGLLSAPAPGEGPVELLSKLGGRAVGLASHPPPHTPLPPPTRAQGYLVVVVVVIVVPTHWLQGWYPPPPGGWRIPMAPVGPAPGVSCHTIWV